MNRMTQKDSQGNWCLRGLPWKKLHIGEAITKEVSEKLYGALWKLMEYENTGLEPEEIEDLNDFESSNAKKYLYELAQNRWIPVEERLPEEDGDCLVTMVTPGYFNGQPYTNWLCWDGDGREWTDTDGDPIQSMVVAWKPIPEPYQPVN